FFGLGARRIKLPSLIGYMVLGALLGPSFLDVLDEATAEALAPITEIVLGFVALSIGAELKLTALRRLGSGIVAIIFAESLTAFGVVTIAIYGLTGDLPLALIFGAMAPASAPAGTVAVIQEYRAKGSLTKALYAVVGFDDGLAIVIFGFAAAVAKSLLLAEGSGAEESVLPSLLAPLVEIGLSLLVGVVVGFAFCQITRRLSNGYDILIVAFGAVLLGTGLSERWHLSLILTNMVTGFVLVNTQPEAKVRQVSTAVREIMPLLFVLFFCLAGAHLRLSALPALGAVGLVYILGRSVGLVGGARIGGMLGKVDDKIKKYLGMGILSQAGVAIGLSLIVKQEFESLAVHHGLPHAAEIGAKVITVITATCIVFEIGGPILTKIALEKAGEIPKARTGRGSKGSS
ncbi:MAG: hypothetical protein DRI90_13245, partial [Deltaproteobacteria bacterium]